MVGVDWSKITANITSGTRETNRTERHGRAFGGNHHWYLVVHHEILKKNTPLPNLVLVSERVHPQSSTWNLNRMVSKRNLLSQGLIFRFYVKLQGCSWISIINSVIEFFNITTLPGLDWESFYLRATSSTHIVWNITRSLNKHIQIHIATSSTWSVTILVPDHFH